METMAIIIDYVSIHFSLTLSSVDDKIDVNW